MRVSALALLLLACAGGATPEADTATSEKARRATRPELGRLWLGDFACPATLIRPNVVLAAPGCVPEVADPVEGRSEPLQGKAFFGGATFAADRALDLAGEATLVRLASPVPATVAKPAGSAQLAKWALEVPWQGRAVDLRDLIELQADAWAGARAEVPDELTVFVAPTVSEPVAAPRVAEAPAAADEVTSIDWEMLVNLGKTVWKVIEENAPVVRLQYDYATALPAGVSSAWQLDGFSDLQQQSWRVWGVNGFGMTVYDVTWTVVHQYGGAYAGRGKYLATVAVIPSHVDVLWGYTLDMEVTDVSTLNVGSAEDPVASLALELKLHVRTVIKDHTTTQLFQFRGDSAEVVATPLE